MNRDEMAPRPTGRQLHGWKDISSYFSRSVRTVQRWEREFGLPIHRYGIGHSEVVHAYVEELEQWKDTAEAGGAEHVRTAEEGVEEPGGGVGDGSVRTERRRGPWRALRIGLVFAVGVLGAGAAVTLLWPHTARRPGVPVPAGQVAPAGAVEPANWDYETNTLVVRNSAGKLLWQHAFPFQLELRDRNWLPDSPGSPVRIRDIDQDGRREVLVLARPADRRADGFRFYAFNHSGTLRWTYAHSVGQVFGDTTYPPPFLGDQIILTPGSRGRPDVWLVSVHRPWFPSVLVRVDTDGRVLSKYWSSGYVTAVWTGDVAGKAVVLVGARNNESEGASLAMLDRADPSGSAPAANPFFQCRTCPTGRPLQFVQFPKPVRLRPLHGTSPVTRLDVDALSRIVVWVDHSAGWDPAHAGAIYTLDAELRPLSAGVNDEYRVACSVLEQKRLVPRMPNTPGVDEIDSIRWWDGAKFVDLKVPTSRHKSVR
jgi:hypothetical protein